MEITAFQFCFTTSSTANSIGRRRRKLFVARGSYTTSKRIRYIIEALVSPRARELAISARAVASAGSSQYSSLFNASTLLRVI